MQEILEQRDWVVMLVQVLEILELLELVEMVEMVVMVMAEVQTREAGAIVEWVAAEEEAVAVVPVEPTLVRIGVQVKLDMMVAMLTDQQIMVVGLFLVVLEALVELLKVDLDIMDMMDIMDLLEIPETLVIVMLEIVDLPIPEILETLGLLEIQGILEIPEIPELTETLEM